MKTALELPDDLKRRVKLRAVHRNRADKGRQNNDDKHRQRGKMIRLDHFTVRTCLLQSH